MKILNKYKASYLYGKALSKFLKGKYDEAILIFENICLLDSKYKNEGYTRYYLARSYNFLDQKEKAKKEMAIAYDMIKSRVQKDTERKDIEYLKTLSSEYSNLLKKVGENKLAETIRQETMELCERA